MEIYFGIFLAIILSAISVLSCGKTYKELELEDFVSANYV